MKLATKLLFIPFILLFAHLAFNNTFAVAPSFDKNFGDYLTDSTPDQY
jgi:hypothetical protein